MEEKEEENDCRRIYPAENWCPELLFVLSFSRKTLPLHNSITVDRCRDSQLKSSSSLFSLTRYSSLPLPFLLFSAQFALLWQTLLWKLKTLGCFWNAFLNLIIRVCVVGQTVLTFLGFEQTFWVIGEEKNSNFSCYIGFLEVWGEWNLEISILGIINS